MIYPNTIRPHRNAILFGRLIRDEQGGSLVDTAISFLILLTLIFGVIEGAFAVYSYHYLANAAHEGTRYAIVRGGSWGFSCDGTGSLGSGYNTSGCTANVNDVKNFVASRNFPGLNVTAAEVCVQYSSSTPASTVTPCITSSATSTDNVRGDIVQVTIAYPFVLGIPGLPTRTIWMTSTSQMAIAQ